MLLNEFHNPKKPKSHSDSCIKTKCNKILSSKHSFSPFRVRLFKSATHSNECTLFWHHSDVLILAEETGERALRTELLSVAEPFAHQVGHAYIDEHGLGLLGNGLGQQSLARSRWPEEEDSLLRA